MQACICKDFPVGELEVPDPSGRFAARYPIKAWLDGAAGFGGAVLERRQEERLLTLRTGKIRIPGSAPDIECTIFDVSSTGACILLPKGAELPATFDLSIDPDELHHACKLAWKSGHKVGVRFQTAAAT
jgi:hypothetical protein